MLDFPLLLGPIKIVSGRISIQPVSLKARKFFQRIWLAYMLNLFASLSGVDH
jgi:hypothetical protein